MNNIEDIYDLDEDERKFIAHINSKTYDEFIEYVDKGAGFDNNIIKDWRYGQLLFNTLAYFRPDISGFLRSSINDPFHKEKDQVKDKTYQIIESMW